LTYCQQALRPLDRNSLLPYHIVRPLDLEVLLMVGWNLLIPLLITSIVTITGWFFAHRLASARDRANKLRDLRVEYLIEAWRRLEGASNRQDSLRAGDIESAIADIQLFGSLRQIELARKFVEEFAETGSSSVDKLLTDLRCDLRSSLGLPADPNEVKWWLRIEPPQVQKPKTRVQTSNVRPTPEQT